MTSETPVVAFGLKGVDVLGPLKPCQFLVSERLQIGEIILACVSPYDLNEIPFRILTLLRHPCR